MLILLLLCENLSGTTSTQADTPTQSGSEEIDGPSDLWEADSETCDGEVENSQVNSTLSIHNIYCTITPVRSHLGRFGGEQHSFRLNALVCVLVVCD